MARKSTWLTGLVGAAAAVAFAVAPTVDAEGTATQAAPSGEATHAVHSDAHATTAIDVERLAATEKSAPAAGWPVPNPRSYYLEASCQPHAAAIRQGAGAWDGLTEGGGTPVECRNDYIHDCGGGGNIVGCNWGQGQRIALYMGGVNDDALLAAHEFGHDWYGHSNHQCAGWGSPEEVMAPSICNLRSGQVQRIDG
ncbi:MAG: hypothetical protein ACRDQF_14035 [Thermocrispum sp.]